MRIRKTISGALVGLLVAAMPAASETVRSAEAIFWEKPETIHNFKNSTDLHSLATSILSLAELEFVNLTDRLIQIPFSSKVTPVSSGLEKMHQGYHGIPRWLLFHRFEQLMDALQLRQLSLADARTFFFSGGSLFEGNRGGVIVPMMQMRVYKILILVEDVVDDVDKLAMIPINAPINAFREENIRVRSVGYASDLVGGIRRVFFRALRAVDKELLKLSSGLVYSIEGIRDGFIRHKRYRQNSGYLIYARVPREIYEAHSKFLKKKAEILKASEESLVIVSPMRHWKKAPEALHIYVVTQDEIDHVT